MSEVEDRRCHAMDAIQGELGRQSGELSGIRALVERLDKDISELRMPNRFPLFVQGGVAVFLLTVVGLLYQGLDGRMNSQQDALVAVVAKLDEHDDGHPTYVTEMVKEVLAHIGEKIETVDKQHAAEHIEQEDDIQELRKDRDLAEKRLDAISERVVRLETIADERTERFKAVLGYRDKIREMASGDRWTGGQEEVFQQGHQQLHELEREQLKAIYQELESIEHMRDGGKNRRGRRGDD